MLFTTSLFTSIYLNRTYMFIEKYSKLSYSFTEKIAFRK
jgi:hypothetical protein